VYEQGERGVELARFVRRLREWGGMGMWGARRGREEG
jgi:hypothetical protein